VDFWTAIRGGQARLEVHRQETCPTCHGQASTGGPTQCPECNGTGQVTQMGGRMKFNIPCPRCNGTGAHLESPAHLPRRGWSAATSRSSFASRPARATGSAFACKARATPGLNGGAAGDLFLIVRTGTHPVFTRVGDDIHLTVPVTVPEASLGAKVDVPTIDGRAQLKIPPGTQSGQKLRMRERGVESAQHPGQRGDQIVTIEVQVPTLCGRAQPRDHARAGQAEQPGPARGAV
jgi:molecular chaperone DnaJ